MISQFAFWLTGGALALLIARRSSRTRDWEIGVGMFLPAVLLLLCLWQGNGFGDFRLRIQGLDLHRDALVNAVQIGGNADGDDIVFPGLPAMAGQLRQAPTGATQWLLPVGGTESDDRLPLAEVQFDDGRRWIVGSQPFRPGDLVCLSYCDSPNRLVLRLRQDGRGMESLHSGEPLPEFRSHPLGTFGIFWGPRQAIYPLRDYGVPWRGVDEGAQQPCRGRFLCRGNRPIPVQSFVYRSCGGENCLRIVLLDPDARLFTSGREVPRAQLVGIPFDRSAVKRIVFYTTAYGSPFADPFGGSRPGSNLTARGAIEPTVDGGTINLKIAGGRTVAIERSTLDEAADSAQGPLNLTIVGGQDRGASGSLNPLVISTIGGSTARALGQRLIFDQSDGYGRTGNSFSLSGRNDSLHLGQSFLVGDAAPLRAIHLRLDRLDRPAALTLAMPFLWAWLLCFGQYRYWRKHRLAFLLAAVMQWLLALRLLIGAEAASLDPTLTLDTAISGNIVAYVGLPLALAIAPSREDESRVVLWPAILFAALIAGTVAWNFGTGTTMALASGAILLAAAANAWPVLLALCKAVWARILIWRGWFGQPREVVTQNPIVSIRLFLRQKWWAWAFFIAALVAFRLLLLALGIRERFRWPAPFAVSIIYIPPLLVGFAGLFASVIRSSKPEARALIMYNVLLVVSLIIIPYLVGDFGLFIYLIPIATMAFTITNLRGTGRLNRLLWSSVPLIGVGILVSVAAAGNIEGRSWQSDVASVVEEARTARTVESLDAANARGASLLADATDDDRNWLRLWTALAPDRVARSGTSDAESQKRVSQLLSAYTARLAGYGYMSHSNPADILPYQADDNVTAIHLMAPFGRIGAAVLLLMLGVLAWRVAPLTPQIDRPGIAGVLAIWTLCATAAYMILANLQIVPFTGRNVYLLGALSTSDLLEGYLLFFIASRGLGSSN